MAPPPSGPPGRGAARPAFGPLHVVLPDPTPAATARWLVAAFGFEPAADIPDAEPEPEQAWVELRVGRGEAAVILWSAPDGGDGEDGPTGTDGAPAVVPWVFVDDLDAHLARAEAAGATIVAPITHHGFRSYTAADPQGRHWLLAQSPPSPHPA